MKCHSLSFTLCF